MVKYNENAIREAAYYNWQNAGCPMGKDEYFWAMAIEQLNKKCSSCNSTKKTSTTKKSTSSLKKNSVNNTMNLTTIKASSIKASTKVATKKTSKK
jgi:hypothetical protein